MTTAGISRVKRFADYPEGSRALLLATTDPASFVPGTIWTDHLFLTWTPEFFQSFDDYLLGYNKIRTANTVMNHVRFYEDYDILHYILPMHVDDIMARQREAVAALEKIKLTPPLTVAARTAGISVAQTRCALEHCRTRIKSSLRK